MKKLYTEKHYKDYSKLLERMANTESINEHLEINIEIQVYFAANKISEEARRQMDDRMEQEFIEGKW